MPLDATNGWANECFIPGRLQVHLIDQGSIRLPSGGRSVPGANSGQYSPI